MLVPKVELREEPAGQYRFAVWAAPEIASGLLRPELPKRCTLDGPERTPDRTNDELLLKLAYTIDCANAPLEPADELHLPWLVDGIELTAHWADGTSRRALFGRDAAGVVIRIHLILDRQPSLSDLASQHLRSGLDHATRSWSHLVLVLAIVLSSGGSAGASALAVVSFMAGNAIALVLADLGLTSLPALPSEAVAAGAAVLVIARLIKNGEAAGLPLLLLCVGALHGLGTANELVRSASTSGPLAVSLWFESTGVDLGHAIVAAVLLLMFRASGGIPTAAHRRAGLLSVAGITAVVVFFVSLKEAVIQPSPPTELAGFMEVESRAPENVSTSTAASGQGAPSDAMELPFMSHIVVEPYQVRHEVLVELEPAREWLEPELAGADAVPVDLQQELGSRLARLVEERSPLLIDGLRAQAASRRADFVTLGPTGALTRATPIPEAIESAIVGVTLVFETESMADSVEIEWGLFSQSVSSVALMVMDPESTVETELTVSRPGFAWHNALEGFEAPAIEAVSVSRPKIAVASIVLAILGVALLARRRKAIAAICLTAAYVAYPFARVETALPTLSAHPLDEGDLAVVTERLLTNIYRCFDIHNEEAIYDRLALSITGEQLLEIYLESRRALELDDRGGARVRVDEVVVESVRSLESVDGGGYALNAVWSAGGSVNHFGHIHFRQNRYDASVVIVPVDGSWKIRSVELVEEKRVL